MAYKIGPLLRQHLLRWRRYSSVKFDTQSHFHLLKPSSNFHLISHRKYHQTNAVNRGEFFNLNSVNPPKDESEDEYKESRNEKKRVARRAVKFGMKISTFSTIQIKRILKVASLNRREVFDAILLAKTLKREAKRRQFNLVGKLLREVEPELIDSLIMATLDGDKRKFENLFGLGSWDIVKEDEDYLYTESEDDEQDSGYHTMVERWYEGLINKDISITNEVYALHDVEFDRQELRRLVRTVHSVQGNQISSDEKVEEAEAKAEAEVKAKVKAQAKAEAEAKAKAEAEAEAKHLRAKNALGRFLRKIAKQMPED